MKSWRQVRELNINVYKQYLAINNLFLKTNGWLMSKSYYIFVASFSKGRKQNEVITMRGGEILGEYFVI